MNSNVTITGKLQTISPFKQLIVKCDSPEKLTQFESEGKHSWQTNDDGEVICKIKIPSWNQSEKQLQKYDDMRGDFSVSVSARVKPYDFTNYEGEAVKGVTCCSVSSVYSNYSRCFLYYGRVTTAGPFGTWYVRDGPCRPAGVVVGNETDRVSVGRRGKKLDMIIMGKKLSASNIINQSLLLTYLSVIAMPVLTDQSPAHVKLLLVEQKTPWARVL